MWMSSWLRPKYVTTDLGFIEMFNLWNIFFLQIRVVNAFRHGMDSQQLQQASSNPNIQRVLQKQASLSGKRFSVAGSSQASVQVTSETSAAGASTRITIPEQSFSHTETAV